MLYICRKELKIMKKNFKNKSIKILITSLLCSLAFTCVNVSAMRESDNKDNNTKIISTDNTTKNDENLDKKEKNTITEKFDRLYKTIFIFHQKERFNRYS